MDNNKKIVRQKGEFSDRFVLKTVGPDTRQALIDARVRIARMHGKQYDMAYTTKKPKMLKHFYLGCDLLQYSIIVKPFIKKLYKIDKDIELDILLYLFPIQYFTMKDFKTVMLPFRKYNIFLKTMIELCYVEKIIDSDQTKTVYRLTTRGIKIVRDYYAYLSGEKKMKEKGVTNPFKDPEKTKTDGQLEDLMLNLNDRSETMPYLFNGDIS